MQDHREKAKELFGEGYNCAQAVFAAFCDETGMDFETALKLSSSFGGGMGRLREVCGAVSAMFMVAGIKYGYTNPKDDTTKQKHYELIQELAKKFKDKNGTIICRELLALQEQAISPVPSKRTKEYYESRPCSELVGDGAEIVDELIKEKLKETNL